MKETYPSFVESPSPTTSTAGERKSPLADLPAQIVPFELPSAELTSDTALPPPGISDQAAYLAGERAAWSRAFQAALPSQHALGQLVKAVDTLHARIEEDAATLRRIEIDQARASTSYENAIDRVNELERQQLPALQQKWEALALRPPVSPEIVEALQQLRDVLSDLANDVHTTNSMRNTGSFPLRHLQFLFQTLAKYTAGVISNADVAALFIARKILLVDVVSAREQQQRKGQGAVGAVLFIAAVEGLWRLHELLRKSVPITGGRTPSPLYHGLKTMRIAVWGAAFVFGAHEAKNAANRGARAFLQYIPYTTKDEPNRTRPGSSLSTNSDRIVDNVLFEDPSTSAEQP